MVVYSRLRSGRYVEIDGDGWRLVDAAPVMFRRSAFAHDLPDPVPGDATKVLKHVRIRDPHDRRMFVAWLATVLLADVPARYYRRRAFKAPRRRASPASRKRSLTRRCRKTLCRTSKTSTFR